jgi:uncharacterized membrane protein
MENEPNSAGEPVWTFRGYAMRPGEFNTAMVHFYRAEIQRSNTWRTRLDTTTNWAIISASAAITFTLSEPTRHHGVILFTIGLMAVFLFIEARRYRYYELWSYRTRLIETEFFAAMLVPPFAPASTWAEELANSLRHPKFNISMLEALGRRLRRNYLAIFFGMLAVWVFKNLSQPTTVASWNEFIERANIGPLSGELVLLLLTITFIAIVVLAVGTIRLQQATGEVLTPYNGMEGVLTWLGGREPNSED